MRDVQQTLSDIRRQMVRFLLLREVSAGLHRDAQVQAVRGRACAGAQAEERREVGEGVFYSGLSLLNKQQMTPPEYSLSLMPQQTSRDQ